MVPALPDYAAGLIPRKWISASIPDQLPPNFSFLQARVTEVLLRRKLVRTTMGEVTFDYLVIATGSMPSPSPDALTEHKTYTVTSITDATELKNALDQYLQSTPESSIVINGAGYTGIELAICIARRAKRDGIPINIHLVELNKQILPFLTASQQERVLRSIERHAIHLHTGCQISSAEGDAIRLSDGTEIRSPLLCRAEGTISPLPTNKMNIPKLPDGRLEVESTLGLTRFPNVFVAGDAAAFHIPTGYLRKAVNFAYYAGAHAGKNIWRVIKKRKPRPFKPIDLGWVIPLGDDSVGKAFGSMPLAGKIGLRLHYVMCGYRNYSLRNFLYLCGHAIRAGRKITPPKTRRAK